MFTATSSRPPSRTPSPGTITVPPRRLSIRRRLAADDEVEASDQLHPLTPTGETELDSRSDVSRPTLRRLTTETERQVAELAESTRSGPSGASEGSRPSLDMLRMSSTEESAEVEVLVHRVKPSESIAGIALLYGIDVSVLRKINKLWTSDSVHLKTHLYVPLEACKWNKASETFIRGPGPGQVTLVSKTSGRKGRAPARSQSESGPSGSGGSNARSGPSTSTSKLVNTRANGYSGSSGSNLIDDDSNEHDEWDSVAQAKSFLQATNMTYDRSSIDSVRPSAAEMEEPEQRIVDVVRIPNSQLRFFPRPQKPPDRQSLDVDMRRVSLENGLKRSVSMKQTNGPSIQNDLHTLPPVYQGATGTTTQGAPKSNVVKIRPAESRSLRMSSTTNNIADTIADRITSFFTIPPPPDQHPTLPVSQGITRSRAPLPSNSAPASRRFSVPAALNPDVLLEMKPTRGNARPVKSNKKLD